MGGSPCASSWWHPSPPFLPFFSFWPCWSRGLSRKLRPSCRGPYIPITGSIGQTSDIHRTIFFSWWEHTSEFMTLIETEKSNPHMYSYKLQDLLFFFPPGELILISFLYIFIASIAYSLSSYLLPLHHPCAFQYACINFLIFYYINY